MAGGQIGQGVAGAGHQSGSPDGLQPQGLSEHMDADMPERLEMLADKGPEMGKIHGVGDGDMGLEIDTLPYGLISRVKEQQGAQNLQNRCRGNFAGPGPAAGISMFIDR